VSSISKIPAKAPANKPTITRALSVRQPYIELILSGRKTIEYRSRRTNVRERVYLYASTFPGPAEAFVSVHASTNFGFGGVAGKLWAWLRKLRIARAVRS
jgi:hypothetical protein